MIIIRPTLPEEEEAVVSISIAKWRRAYVDIVDSKTLANLCPQQGLERRRRRHDLPHRYSYVAVHEGKVVGFCDFGVSRSSNYGAGEIYAIYIAQAFQGQQIGRRLVQAAQEILEKLQLTPIMVSAFKDNEPARFFYEKLGFQETGSMQCQIGEVVYVWQSTLESCP